MFERFEAAAGAGFTAVEYLFPYDHDARHEPGTGEIDYAFLVDFIDRVGYAGWIGCEYIPKAETVEGLGWAAPYLSRQRSD